MPSLKDLKNRIASVKSTRKITRAMQLVAAAKLRRAEEAARAARPYSERMEAVLGNLAASMADNPGAPRLLAGTGSDKRHLLIVATSERGLCGGFNTSIVRLARQYVDRLLAEGKEVQILTVGRKGRDQLRRLYSKNLTGPVDMSQVRQLQFADAQRAARQVLDMFDARQFDVATIFYSRFKSVVSQIPTAQQLIPAKAPEAVAEDAAHAGAVYEYEPDPASILDDLIPRNISVQIFRALLENVAGEMGAKMSAMDNATRNAGEMINKLTLSYNRQRQAQITKELIEIISGAEAL